MAGSGALDIEYNKAQLKEVKRMLSAIPRGFEKAASRAINKTATTIRSKITKLVKKYIPLKLKDIRKKITIRKANRSMLQAIIMVKGGQTPLIKFNAKQTKNGVTFKLDGKRSKSKHSFIATMPSGHTGVYERRIEGGKRVNRLSIGGNPTSMEGEHYGPSVLSAYLRSDKNIRLDAAKLLEKYTAAQVKLLLEKG